jgi:hypothetical protein
MKQQRPHWYRQYLGSCPVCGANKSYRKRVYGRKPKDTRRCYVYRSDWETYDHCIG